MLEVFLEGVGDTSLSENQPMIVKGGGALYYAYLGVGIGTVYG